MKKGGCVCECEGGGGGGDYQRALDLRTKSSTRTRLDLNFCACSQKDTPESFILLFSPKTLVWLFIVREVKPSPYSKMIKPLTFDNLFPPFPATTTSLKTLEVA